MRNIKYPGIYKRIILGQYLLRYGLTPLDKDNIDLESYIRRKSESFLYFYKKSHEKLILFFHTKNYKRSTLSFILNSN